MNRPAGSIWLKFEPSGTLLLYVPQAGAGAAPRPRPVTLQGIPMTSTRCPHARPCITGAYIRQGRALVQDPAGGPSMVIAAQQGRTRREKPMKRVIDYIDQLKDVKGWKTDYRAAKELGW